MKMREQTEAISDNIAASNTQHAQRRTHHANAYVCERLATLLPRFMMMHDRICKRVRRGQGALAATNLWSRLGSLSVARQSPFQALSW